VYSTVSERSTRRLRSISVPTSSRESRILKVTRRKKEERRKDNRGKRKRNRKRKRRTTSSTTEKRRKRKREKHALQSRKRRSEAKMRTIQSKQRFPLPCFSDFLSLLPRYPLVVIIQSCSTDCSERARSGVLVLLAMIDIGNFRKTFPLLSFATGVVYDFTKR